MRYLSWAVVLISVGFIAAWQVRDGMIDLSGLAVNEGEVIGTVIEAPGDATVSASVQLAQRYAKAWSSHDPEQVATVFAPDATFVTTGGDSYRGHDGIRRLVGEVLAEVPDMQLVMDSLESEADHLVFHWTFIGTHTASGRNVQISGTETWRLDASGLIAESHEHYDADAYAAQIEAPPAD
jgi:uncharacterized protein (TIGR02246 family)